MTSLSMYHIVLFTIVVPGIIYVTGNSRRNQVGLLTACAIMICVSGLRHGYIDTRNYRVGFEACNPMTVFRIENLLQSRNPGFDVINGVLRLFTDDGQIFLFIMALVTVWCLYSGLVNRAPRPVLAIFLLISTGCYMDTMNGLRQALAAAVLFYYAPELIQKRKLGRFLLLVALMWSIHLSALIYIPLYWLCYSKAWNKKTWFLILGGVAVFSFFNLGIGQLVANILENASGDSNYYSGYADMLLNANTSVDIMRIPIAIAPVVLSYFAKEPAQNEVTQYDICVHMSIVNMILWFLATKVIYFYRLCMFFAPFMIVQLCWSIRYFKGSRSSKSFITAMVCILYFIYHYCSVYFMGNAFLVGYLKY